MLSFPVLYKISKQYSRIYIISRIGIKMSPVSNVTLLAQQCKRKRRVEKEGQRDAMM